MLFLPVSFQPECAQLCVPPFLLLLQAAITSLQTCIGSDVRPSDIEVGIVTVDNPESVPCFFASVFFSFFMFRVSLCFLCRFHMLTDAEIEAHLSAISERD